MGRRDNRRSMKMRRRTPTEEAQGAAGEEARRWRAKRSPPREQPSRRRRRPPPPRSKRWPQAPGRPGLCRPRQPTALMRQYLDVKARYPDAIVFFRLGDFYEMFLEDAVYAARVLDLTLTTRDKGKEDPGPDVRHPAPRGAPVPGQADRARPSGRAVRAARGSAGRARHRQARRRPRRHAGRGAGRGVAGSAHAQLRRRRRRATRGAATAWRSWTSRPAISAPPRRPPARR